MVFGSNSRNNRDSRRSKGQGENDQGLGSDEDSGEESSEDDGIELTRVVLGDEDVMFSCSSCLDSEDRELYMTKSRLIVRIGSRGCSFPLDEGAVSFSEKTDQYRITVSNGSRGDGLTVDEEDFVEFWREFTAHIN